MSVHQSQLPLIKRDDTWAIIIALGLTLLLTFTFLNGGIAFFKPMAVSFPTWADDFSKVTKALSKIRQV